MHFIIAIVHYEYFGDEYQQLFPDLLNVLKAHTVTIKIIYFSKSVLIFYRSQVESILLPNYYALTIITSELHVGLPVNSDRQEAVLHIQTKLTRADHLKNIM